MCTTERRNGILKKSVSVPKDIAVLFDCTLDMSYRYIEDINQWLRDNGRTTITRQYRGARKQIRTIDYIDFVGLPRDLML